MITQSITCSLLHQSRPCPRRLGTAENATTRLAKMGVNIPLAHLTRDRASALPDSLIFSMPPPHRVAIQSLVMDACASANRRALSMQRPNVQNTSLTANNAAVYRTKAILALRANASLSARLARYNCHMATARCLEAIGISSEDLKTAACHR